jgi:hypothetical protein
MTGGSPIFVRRTQSRVIPIGSCLSGVVSKPFDLDELRRLVGVMAQRPLDTTLG